MVGSVGRTHPSPNPSGMDPCPDPVRYGARLGWCWQRSGPEHRRGRGGAEWRVLPCSGFPYRRLFGRRAANPEPVNFLACDPIARLSPMLSGFLPLRFRPGCAGLRIRCEYRGLRWEGAADRPNSRVRPLACCDWHAIRMVGVSTSTKLVPGATAVARYYLTRSMMSWDRTISASLPDAGVTSHAFSATQVPAVSRLTLAP